MIVRSATEQDLEFMAGLTHEARSFATASDPQAWEAESEEEMVERLRVYLPGEKRTSFVVEAEGRVIAFAACRIVATGPGERGAVVDILAVSQDYRGRGIGTQLVREMTSQLAAAGVHRLNVHVASDNEAAVRFWRRLGFTNLALTMSLPLQRAEARG